MGVKRWVNPLMSKYPVRLSSRDFTVSKWLFMGLWRWRCACRAKTPTSRKQKTIAVELEIDFHCFPPLGCHVRKTTIRTKDPCYQDLIGKTNNLSFYDIKSVNLMYRWGKMLLSCWSNKRVKKKSLSLSSICFHLVATCIALSPIGMRANEEVSLPVAKLSSLF